MKKPKSSMTLQLDGKIYLIERRAGKRAKKTELDSKLCLDAIIYVLNLALDDMGKKS